MLNIIIFGAPGCGKGTQSELISKKYNLNHISTGNILREEIQQQTSLGKTAQDFISKGQLVPDELIIDILSNEIDKKKESKGIIFDGFPRTIPQAEALDQLLRNKNTSIAATLNLDVEEKELIQRLVDRGKSSGRGDDNPDVIAARLTVYYAQTEPLKKYYKKQGKFFNIKGSGYVSQ